MHLSSDSPTPDGKDLTYPGRRSTGLQVWMRRDPQVRMRSDSCALQVGPVSCHLSPNVHPANCPSLLELLTHTRPTLCNHRLALPESRTMDKTQDTELWPTRSDTGKRKEHPDVSIKRDGAEEEAILERTTRVRRVFSFTQFFAFSLAYMGAWEGVCV